MEWVGGCVGGVGEVGEDGVARSGWGEVGGMGGRKLAKQTVWVVPQLSKMRVLKTC